MASSSSSSSSLSLTTLNAASSPSSSSSSPGGLGGMSGLPDWAAAVLNPGIKSAAETTVPVVMTAAAAVAGGADDGATSSSSSEQPARKSSASSSLSPASPTAGVAAASKKGGGGLMGWIRSRSNSISQGSASAAAAQEDEPPSLLRSLSFRSRAKAPPVLAAASAEVSEQRIAPVPRKLNIDPKPKKVIVPVSRRVSRIILPLSRSFNQPKSHESVYTLRRDDGWVDDDELLVPMTLQRPATPEARMENTRHDSVHPEDVDNVSPEDLDRKDDNVDPENVDDGVGESTDSTPVDSTTVEVFPDNEKFGVDNSENVDSGYASVVDNEPVIETIPPLRREGSVNSRASTTHHPSLDRGSRDGSMMKSSILANISSRLRRGNSVSRASIDSNRSDNAKDLQRQPSISSQFSMASPNTSFGSRNSHTSLTGPRLPRQSTSSTGSSSVRPPRPLPQIPQASNPTHPLAHDMADDFDPLPVDPVIYRPAYQPKPVLSKAFTPPQRSLSLRRNVMERKRRSILASGGNAPSASSNRKSMNRLSRRIVEIEVLSEDKGPNVAGHDDSAPDGEHSGRFDDAENYVGAVSPSSDETQVAESPVASPTITKQVEAPSPTAVARKLESLKAAEKSPAKATPPAASNSGSVARLVSRWESSSPTPAKQHSATRTAISELEKGLSEIEREIFGSKNDSAEQKPTAGNKVSVSSSVSGATPSQTVERARTDAQHRKRISVKLSKGNIKAAAGGADGGEFKAKRAVRKSVVKRLDGVLLDAMEATGQFFEVEDDGAGPEDSSVMSPIPAIVEVLVESKAEDGDGIAMIVGDGIWEPAEDDDDGADWADIDDAEVESWKRLTRTKDEREPRRQDVARATLEPPPARKVNLDDLRAANGNGDPYKRAADRAKTRTVATVNSDVSLSDVTRSSFHSIIPSKSPSEWRKISISSSILDAEFGPDARARRAWEANAEPPPPIPPGGLRPPRGESLANRGRRAGADVGNRRPAPAALRLFPSGKGDGKISLFARLKDLTLGKSKGKERGFDEPRSVSHDLPRPPRLAVPGRRPSPMIARHLANEGFSGESEDEEMVAPEMLNRVGKSFDDYRTFEVEEDSDGGDFYNDEDDHHRASRTLPRSFGAVSVGSVEMRRSQSTRRG